jgi:hypothetical protein
MEKAFEQEEVSDPSIRLQILEETSTGYDLIIYAHVPLAQLFTS